MKGIIVCLFICLFSCSGNQTKDSSNQSSRFTDPRDGETYRIVSIGNQTWMAENLRYNAPGSWSNPDNPSITYGRLYDGITAQLICPDGWHLPSDDEWNELEIALGLSAADAENVGWRGEHGSKMKSDSGWIDDWSEKNLNGTNTSGFNAFPTGYYDWDDGYGGLGMSGGYWTSAKNGIAWMRWFAGPKKGVNRFYDDNLISSGGAACRCIMD